MYGSMISCILYLGSPISAEMALPLKMSSNVTYSDSDMYYNFASIKEYGNRKYVYDLYENNKYFKEEELNAEKKIIEMNSIPIKENFIDYYE